MINQQVFNEEIAILCDWFGRKFEEKTLKRLYDRLINHGVTEEEFRRACLALFDSSDRFPNPQAFVDAAKGDREAIAAADWGWIVKAAASSRPEWYLENNVTQAGIAAIKELGGVRKLGAVEQKELPWYRKEFLARWAKLDRTIKTESIELNYQPRLEGGNGNGKH